MLGDQRPLYQVCKFEPIILQKCWLNKSELRRRRIGRGMICFCVESILRFVKMETVARFGVYDH